MSKPYIGRNVKSVENLFWLDVLTLYDKTRTPLTPPHFPFLPFREPRHSRWARLSNSIANTKGFTDSVNKSLEAHRQHSWLAQMYGSIVSWRRAPMPLATWELQLLLLHWSVRGLTPNGNGNSNSKSSCSKTIKNMWRLVGGYILCLSDLVHVRTRIASMSRRPANIYAPQLDYRRPTWSLATMKIPSSNGLLAINTGCSSLKTKSLNIAWDWSLHSCNIYNELQQCAQKCLKHEDGM